MPVRQSSFASAPAQGISPERPHDLREATDRRRSARRKAWLSGRILFNLDRSSMSVRVRDLSGSGARVTLSIPWPCPKRFSLEVDMPGAGMQIRQCEVVWQHGLTIGLRFTAAGSRRPAR